MWSRVVELMLGCWLLVSPFIFGHQAEDTLAWTTDLAGGVAIIALALLSYWPPTRHAHLVTFLIALLLMGATMLLVSRPLPPGDQNHVLVGGLLLMFALVPNRASFPPPEFIEPVSKPPKSSH